MQRRRRSLFGGAAAALAVALTSAFGIASFAGTDLAGAAVARASNLADLLNQRSPGSRIEGQLTKTKSHAVLAERGPAPPAVVAPANFAEVLAPPPPSYLPVDVASPAAELQFMPLPAAAVFLSPPGGSGGSPGGGSGGGGGGGGGGGPPPGSPTVPVPAVPEPGTWMTMLLGFALLGWALRRQQPAFAMRAAE